MNEHCGGDRKQHSNNKGRQGYDKGHKHLLSALGNSCAHRSKSGIIVRAWRITRTGNRCGLVVHGARCRSFAT